MADRAAGPTSRTYFSQRLRLHYVDWGNPDKPALILLHGGRDHCRSWDWTAEALRDDWHVIAPDLRGHGDSQWPSDGHYSFEGYVYDLAQLIHQQGLAPVSLIAHSLGGHIALRYAGVYPETVARLVAIEGLGPRWVTVDEGRSGSPGTPRASGGHGGPAARPPVSEDEEFRRFRKPIHERMDEWIRGRRALAGRLPRRYASLEEAFHRMQEENPRLSAEQALHLTAHGVNQNEDGTYSWKFDNYLRVWPPYDMRGQDIQLLWSRIACPTLILFGRESRFGDPAEDGRASNFPNVRVVGFDGAGHWVHHDRLPEFLRVVRDFLNR
jgi:pimeloyl-ACP methyl ester carboxylesterase